jgi:hypothetical protein
MKVMQTTAGFGRQISVDLLLTISQIRLEQDPIPQFYTIDIPLEDEN